MAYSKAEVMNGSNYMVDAAAKAWTSDVLEEAISHITADNLRSECQLRTPDATATRLRFERLWHEIFIYDRYVMDIRRIF